MSPSDPQLDRVEAMLAGFEQGPDPVVVLAGHQVGVVAANTAAVRRLPHARRGAELRETWSESAPGLLASYDAVLSTGRSGELLGCRLENRSWDWDWTPWLDEASGIVGAVGRGREASADIVAAGLLTSLQDSLLPSELPLVPGVDIAARYLFAADPGRAGGDWFDAIACPNGSVMLVVGDVVGHGPAAAVAMGQLRAVLHERLTSGAELHEALADLDRYAGLRRESFAATVCLVELDPTTGLLAYCTAGHPPPLVVRADGAAQYLPLTGGAPLATGGGFPIVRDQLAAGDLVLLYSDGTVERPGSTPTQGSHDLARLASTVVTDQGITTGPLARPVERVCQLGAEVLTQLGHSDDVTLLAAQRVPAVGPLHVELTTAPGTTASARRALTTWLAELAPRELDDIAIQHAVGELVMNAVEHAYGGERTDAHGRPGTVQLSARVHPSGRLEVTVSDQGRWRRHDEQQEGPLMSVADTVELGARGRGIAMVRGFVDRLVVDTDEHGTRATVHHQLSRPAALLLPPAGPDPMAGVGEAYAVVEDGPRLWVSGALDTEVVDDLRLRLARAGRGGAAGGEIRVDLSGVTLLGSAAVAALHEARQLDDHLVLHAPPGSVAEQVLERVRLPYVG